ncbi:histone [Melaminivora suipulveris]|uniref:Histone n=1 Tax=Melaminivora suipulveris TaxID=2109913 RepID=A0A2R3QEV9_9BURK|nr:H-NS histone family protein [Melaminivora suipulveris]AVO50280.1 histone [Melaminivora suipulveris]
MNEEASYKDLLKEREALDQRIKDAHRREVSSAVSRVREIVAEFDLTPQDVFPSGKAPRATAGTGAKIAPKYRNPATGQTWTGRGKPPRWIQNQDREQFAI